MNHGTMLLWPLSDSTTPTSTHLLYDGEGGWIEATRVWQTYPEPEVDGAKDGPAWEFHNGRDLIRWLRVR